MGVDTLLRVGGHKFIVREMSERVHDTHDHSTHAHSAEADAAKASTEQTTVATMHPQRLVIDDPPALVTPV
jgi:hypothetical protein